MSYFIFNGHRSDEFGLRISGDSVYNAPEREYEKIIVPGRSGALVIDKGTYPNIPVTYPASIAHNLPTQAAALREWLLSASGYCRLEDSYHPDCFRMARYSGGVNFNSLTQKQRAGLLNISFDAKPQRWLKSGEEWLSANNSIKLCSPTPFSSKPVIQITVSGTSGRIWFGSAVIAIVDVAEDATLVIDSETLDVISPSGENMNPNVSISGVVEIPDRTINISSSGLSSLEIQPRWWTL